MYRPLFVLVEGPDDERFFKRVVSPLLSLNYSPIIVTPYAHKTKKELVAYVKSAKQTCLTNDGNYWYIHDKDEKTCITVVKEWIRDVDGVSNVDFSNILIVVEEIEAWYLAGSQSLQRANRITHTNDITKEKFATLSLRSGYASSYDCMLAILNEYSISLAKAKNSSLTYCLQKLGAS